MTSKLKSATSRANGAKSKGPKTAEGREKSSRNSLVHGFTSKNTIVLACENEDEFQEVLGDYSATYQPGSPVEIGVVDEMVACRWRMQRLRVIETALMDSEMDRELPETETEVPTDDPGYRLASAFRRLVDESRAISLVSRYESRLHRIHERCHRILRELQQTRREQTAGPVAPAPVQPEPPPATQVGQPTCPKPEPQPDQLQLNLLGSSSAPIAGQVARRLKKRQNEPKPSSSTAAGKHVQRLVIMGHRDLRRIDIKGLRYFQQRKTA
jgi:hypothetical protein